jgi:hypothetical protein
MNATMKRLMWGAIVGALIVLAVQAYKGGYTPIPVGPSKLTLVGVYESKDLKGYTKDQMDWLKGEKFQKAMDDAGHAYYSVDKDMKDKDDQPPPDLVPFLNAAKPHEKELPVLTMRRAGKTEVKVASPKTRDEAEKVAKEYGG